MSDLLIWIGRPQAHTSWGLWHAACGNTSTTQRFYGRCSLKMETNKMCTFGGSHEKQNIKRKQFNVKFNHRALPNLPPVTKATRLSHSAYSQEAPNATRRRKRNRFLIFISAVICCRHCCCSICCECYRYHCNAIFPLWRNNGNIAFLKKQQRQRRSVMRQTTCDRAVPLVLAGWHHRHTNTHIYHAIDIIPI